MGKPFRGDNQFIERRRVLKPAHRAEGLLALFGGDVAAGGVRVLPGDGAAHRGDRNLVGREPVGIHPNVDGPAEAADHIHFAHPGERSKWVLMILSAISVNSRCERSPDKASDKTGC